MSWSTRELADLAGTTINAVRHYHALGLLDPPERKCNGYKQYQVKHLVKLLQVRRVAALGVALAQVEAACTDSATLQAELRRVDANVAAEIQRLARARSEIATILSMRTPVDTPRGFEDVSTSLSDADLALFHIFTRLYSARGSSRLKEMVAEEPHGLRRGFNALPLDAEESERQHLADRMATETSNWRWPESLWSSSEFRSPGWGEDAARKVVIRAVDELCNSAQRDVLRRIAKSDRAIDLQTVSVAQSA